MELLHGDVTARIIKVFYKVHDELGFGFLEKVCQAAMVIALKSEGLHVAERVVPVLFREQVIGVFIADLVVENKVLIEIKSKSALHPFDEAQAINYLRASDLEVALIMNFGPRATYQRRLLTNDCKPRSRSTR